MGKKTLTVVPLGGLGEIGLNFMVLEFGGRALVVDAGLMFPRENQLGIDYLIPDFEYLRSIRDRMEAYVLTHGHEDHIGALPFLLRELPAPVYGSQFTMALVRERLLEQSPETLNLLHVLPPRKKIHLGPFETTLIPVSHSTLGCRAAVIRTAAGTVVHMGDYKMDPTTPAESRFDTKSFQAIGRKGVLLLLGDSTNVMRQGRAPHERDVAKKYAKIFKVARGRIIIGIFSSHIQRIEQIFALAREHGRKVLLSGRSLLENVEIARQLGQIKIPARTLIDSDELSHHAPHEVCIISTGSQGESRAVLPRMAHADHPFLEVMPGDSVILGTRIIPGNEHSIYQMINAFSRQGAIVYYGDYADIESSGHAYAGEMTALIKMLKPRYLIPVHGEHRHLAAHAQLAVAAGMKPECVLIAENGDRVEISQERLVKTAKVHSGRLCVYGRHLEPTTSPTLKERKSLGRGGVVTAVLGEPITGRSGRHMPLPQILELRTSGIITHADGENDDRLRQEVQTYLETLREAEFTPLSGKKEFQAFIESGIRRYCKKKIGRKPVVLTLWQNPQS